MLVQCCGVATWMGSTKLWGYEVPSGFQVFYLFTDWKSTRGVFADLLPQYLIIILLFVFAGIFITIIAIHYKYNRVFAKWTLYVIRTYIVLYYVLIPPCSSLCGRAFVEMARTASTTSIVLFIFSFIIIIINNLVFIFSINLICCSPYIDNTINAMWDSKIYVITILSNSIGAFLAPVLDIFPDWILVFSLFVHLGIYILEVYFTVFPMLNFLMNVVILATELCGSIAVILTIFRVYFDFPFYVIFITIGIGYVVFLPLSYFIFKWKTDKVVDILNTPEDWSDSQVSVFFDQIIFSSERDAISYIHIGLANCCNSITNFSFFRYIVYNYLKPKIIYSISQVISFFPSERQLLSYLLQVISGFKYQPIHFKFLIYQMKRILVLRQSSNTGATHLLNQLEAMTNDMISKIRGFWEEIIKSNHHVSLVSLSYLNKLTSKTESAYFDALEKYPSSQLFSINYVRFLIEAKGDYKGALYYGKRSSLLERGKQITVDYAFKNFVNAYPRYLVDKIIDAKGNLTSIKSISSVVSNESSESSSMQDVTINGNYDEMISRLYSRGRLRLAIQNLLSTKKMKSLILIDTLMAIQIFVSLIVLIVYVIFIPISSHQVYYSYESFSLISQTIAVYGYANLATTYHYLVTTGSYGGLSELISHIPVTQRDINEKTLFIQNPTFALNMIMNNFRLLLDTIPVHFNEFDYFDEQILFTQYSNALAPSSSFGVTARGVLYLSYSIINDIVANKSMQAKSMDTIMNTLAITELLDSIIAKLTEYGRSVILTFRKTFLIQSLSILSVCFIVFCVLRSLSIINLLKEWREISNMLRRVKREDIEESKKPIYLKDKNKTISTLTSHSAFDIDYVSIMYPIIVALSIITFAGIVLGISLQYLKDISFMHQMFTWEHNGISRLLGILSAYSILCSEGAGIFSSAITRSKAYEYIDSVMMINNEIARETIGKDDNFDNFYFHLRCSTNEVSQFGDEMKCMSRMSQFDLVVTYLANMLNDGSTVNLHSFHFSTLIYLLDSDLCNSLHDFQVELVNMAQNKNNSTQAHMVIWAIAGLVTLAVFFSIEFFLQNQVRRAFKSVKQLILLLPPLSILNNTYIMQFLTGTKSESAYEMSASETIINSASSLAILLDDKTMIIQNVNKCLQTITGFTPDQVLGQPITWLIPPPKNDNSSSDIETSTAQFYQQIKNLDEKVVNINTRCATESGNNKIMKASLLKVEDSIFVMLRDLTHQTEQKKRIKDAKKRSDILIAGLIPPDALNVIKSSKGASLFISDRATVIFIEIIGLSDNIHTMSPKLMLNTMNTIYDTFEAESAKFPAVHTLKTNDDLYVACCGLFDFKDDYRGQAEQAVDFALSILNKLEYLNEQLNTALNLRIGINMGGPLVGSVIDPSTPTFDILGSLIGSAIKMQSDGQVSIVQVSETVKEQLSKEKYKIDKGQILYGVRGMPDQVYLVTEL